MTTKKTVGVLLKLTPEETRQLDRLVRDRGRAGALRLLIAAEIQRLAEGPRTVVIDGRPYKEVTSSSE